MSLEIEENNNKKITSTGTKYEPDDHLIIKYPFGRYEIYIKISPDKKFISIEKITLNSDFRKYRTKTSKTPFRFIDEYKPE